MKFLTTMKNVYNCFKDLVQKVKKQTIKRQKKKKSNKTKTTKHGYICPPPWDKKLHKDMIKLEILKKWRLKNNYQKTINQILNKNKVSEYIKAISNWKFVHHNMRRYLVSYIFCFSFCLLFYLDEMFAVEKYKLLPPWLVKNNMHQTNIFL